MHENCHLFRHNNPAPPCLFVFFTVAVARAGMQYMERHDVKHCRKACFCDTTIETIELMYPDRNFLSFRRNISLYREALTPPHPVHNKEGKTGEEIEDGSKVVVAEVDKVNVGGGEQLVE